MSTFLYKKGLQLVSVSVGLAISMMASAQNLVLNPSFEIVNINNLKCSWYNTKQEFSDAVSNWSLPTDGSSDIFHTSLATTCFSSPFSTNADAVGQQAPRTGDAMAAIFVYGSGGCTPYREYLQGTLSTSLQVGQTYEVEFYVSLADYSSRGANNIGVKFLGSQYNANDMCVYNVTPELNTTNIITDKTGWTKISFCYTPTVSNLRYFIIGNFYDDGATATQNTGTGSLATVRYFVDDVRIEALAVNPNNATNDTVRACQPGNINLYNQISTTLPTTGTWTGPSGLSGGYLGTFNSTSNAYGTYTYTVSNGSCGGDVTAKVVVLGQSASLTGTITSSNAILCNGGTTGVNLSVTGGTAPYSYLWNAGQTTQNLSNVGAGTYSVQITDANNCTIQDNITITEPAALANALTQTQSILCFGDASAALSNNTSGGTAPYAYLWNAGQTTSNVSNLPVGFYKVEIKDANNCVRYDSIQVTEPNSLTSSLASTGALLCNGNSTGITATVAGGTTPYSFAWNTGAVTQNLTNINAGTYSLTVTDANNCTSSSNINITEPTAMTSTLSQLQPIDCHGDLTGINLSATGGTTPYSYLWNAGQTTQNLSNVGAGTYSVQITDANNCTIQDNITITEPAALANALTQTQAVLCFGDASAALSNNTSGGTAPYAYLWNAGQTTSNVSNLPVGFYKVEIKDANNCVYWDSIQVTQPALITAQYQNVFCNTSSYALPSGRVIQSSGIYQDTIPAANGCDSIITLDLTLSNIQTQANMVSNVSCFGFNDGATSVVATGGVQPYNYLWNNNQTTASINNLSPGSYSVIIKDDVNCLDTLTVNITSPAELVVTVSPSVEFCEGNTALLIASAVGGIEPYNVSWSNNVNAWSQNVQPSATTTYTVTVTDNNGCVSTNGTHVTVFPNPVAIITTDWPSPVVAGTTITFNDESKLGDFNFWSLEDGTSYTDKEQIAYTFEEEGEYCVSFVTNTIHNCVDHTRVCVVVHPEFNLYIPNSFTPNGDKNNEYFRVVGRGYNYMKLSIFNRWGEELIRLEGNQPVMIGWDGYYQGKPAPEGVYTYKLEVFDLKNKLHTYFGHLNLIR